MSKIKPLSLPYTLSAQGLLLYYATLAVLLGLMLTRKNNFWQHLPPLTHTWGTHASNLSISGLLYVSIGMFWILQGAKPKHLVWLGGGFIAINFIVELFIPVLNTRDTVDALFGVVGVVIGGLCLCFLWHAKRKNPNAKT